MPLSMDWGQAAGMETLHRLIGDWRALLKTDLSEKALTLTREHKWTLLAVASAGAACYYTFCRHRNLPPGPRGLPLVGAIREFDWYQGIQYDWQRMGEKYGDIFSFYIGNSLLVVLNSHEAIKDAWVKAGEEYVHRIPMVTTDITELYDEMFRAPYDDKWKANRKFTNKAIRAWGFATTTGEGKILVEIDNIHRYLRERGPVPMDPEDFSMKACGNVICDILFNKRFDYNDPEFQIFIDDIMRWVRKWWHISFGETLMLFDILPGWMWRSLWAEEAIYARHTTRVAREHVRKLVLEHIATFDANALRDVTDAYLEDRGVQEADVLQLSNTLLAFVPDGLHTVSAMFKWVIMFLAKYPHVQKRAQRLIDETVGNSRKVMIRDRNKLAYVEAIGMEVVRISNPVPTSGARIPQTDTSFRGYFIPKGAMVYANYFAVHMDPRIYPEPEKFKPERYVTDNGELFKTDAWIPFGMGRRMCPGEQLSKMELFLLTANLLQRYNISFEAGLDPDIWAVEKGIIRRPEPFRVIFTER